MNKIDYQIADNYCATILNEFDVFTDMTGWIKRYKELYKIINIQPNGLPAIANCNYEGIRYEHIAKFHSLYTKTLHFK
jgi:hypothetical protein